MKPTPAAHETSALPLANMDTQEARIIPSEPSVGQMLQSFLQRPQSEQNVAVMERMFDLYEKVEARNAEKEFNAAFVALQSELPVIVAKTIIPNRGKYERYEDLLEVIGPVLAKHGFAVSFSMSTAEARVVETCHLRHIGGHAQSTPFAVRTGGRADSDTQADCKAATTAKRYALINALNIVIRQDESMREENDATIEGGFIGPDKVQYLRERLAEVGGKEAPFLAIAGANTFETIAEGSYPVLIRTLDAKERAKNQAAK